MKQVRILTTYFDGGVPKYVAGQVYDSNQDTERMVGFGHAVYEVGSEVESADPVVIELDVVEVVSSEPSQQVDEPVLTPKRRGRPPKNV